ncbi:MAG: ATP-binding cassette domain-containing protein [Gammaproteobacteria bacterium]|nr:ATP-binding cassette domain-containing protein [Gammaproteobacteria bacterium]
MPLIKLENASLAFGHVPLLDKASLQIDAGERVCLVGRNGVGKSTLLRVLNKTIHLDDGEVWHQPQLRIAYLEQDVPPAESQTVYDVVASGLEKAGQLLAEYHHVAQQMAHDHSESLTNRMASLQQAIDSCDGWRLEQRVNTVLTKLELPGDSNMAELSGGYKRRVMLARALVLEPELLLLDEPTNHLDIEAINWIEEFLLSFNGALLFITHDRSFLRRLATRILELDRGVLTSWPGDYDDYLQKKQERLDAEAQQNAKFDKKLAEEEVWIRQGIKARRTRNEGRVRALKALREERRQRLETMGKVKMQLDAGEQSGKIVIEAKHISKSFGDKNIIKDFSTTILRGDRIGIIGPNGAGKSTLIKLLLGELPPDTGSVELGTKLQTAYFDQQRSQLDLERTVVDNLNQGSDMITVNGQNKHVIGYLQDFLFPPQRARSPVKSLSGGERNRLLLARLFVQPANLLVLDEPTNDLDIETLELLEELLSNYNGTIIVVSHDRAFLDNVATSTIVFEGEGRVEEYVGGYEDWLRQRKTPAPGLENKPSAAMKTAIDQSQINRSQTQKKKLSHKEQRELDTLPERIEVLEQQQSDIQQQINQPDFYKGDPDTINETLARLAKIDAELEGCYQRWEKLI